LSLIREIAGFAGAKSQLLWTTSAEVFVDQFTPGKRGATGNVLFSTGRCFFVVGDLVHDARTSAQGTKAPIAGATALYKRTKHVCA
jgi:hypothetical protein